MGKYSAKQFFMPAANVSKRAGCCNALSSLFLMKALRLNGIKMGHLLKAIFLLIMITIATYSFGRRGGSFVAQPQVTQIYKQEQVRIPTAEEIVQARVAAVAAILQNTLPCNQPQGCRLAASTLTDFIISFKFCSQFNNWSIVYQIAPSLHWILTQLPAGNCQLSVESTPPVAIKPCVVTPQQAQSLASMQNLLILYQEGRGTVPQNASKADLSVIINCFTPETPTRP